MADALPGHWNQKQELGPADQTSVHSWAECIALAAKKGMRLIRAAGQYKVSAVGITYYSAKLDDIYSVIDKYQPPRASR